MINQNQILGLEERLSGMESNGSSQNLLISKFEKSLIRIQFKYDIALNLVKNFCSDYFIDVLQDNSNIEKMGGFVYDTVTETIK